MARPIAPTPKLDAKATKKFLSKVKEGLMKPTGPIPTPKIDSAVKTVMTHARNRQNRNIE